MPTSPRRSVWSSTPPATASASARIVTRCWWKTAWSRSSTASPLPARSRFPAAIRCWGSCKKRQRRNAVVPSLLPLWERGRESLRSPRLRLQPRHRDALARELVGALVVVVAGVAFDPVPVHLMRFQRGVEPLPQIDILDRLLVRGAPAVLLPAMDPAGDALADILAVGGEVDHAGFLERFQRRDRRHQFHAVVGGVRLAALQFLLGVAEFQDRAPAAGAGIARAGAVGENRHPGQFAHAAHPGCVTP